MCAGERVCGRAGVRVSMCVCACERVSVPACVWEREGSGSREEFMQTVRGEPSPGMHFPPAYLAPRVIWYFPSAAEQAFSDALLS